MQTALDYLLERFLAEAKQVMEVDAKTTEVRSGPSDDLTSSGDNEPGSPEKHLERN